MHRATPDASRGELVVVTGMTGAGRSTAAKELEDLGFYVVDNLPPSLLARRRPAGRREPGLEQPIAVVVDVRSGVVLRRRCRPTSPRARPAGTPRWSSSRPPTTCWSAGRRPPGGRTRCRAAAGCSTACSASARCWPTCAATPTWSSTPPRSTCTSSPTGSPRRSARPRRSRLKVTRGQLRLQVRHPGRRRLRRRHAVPAQPALGARAAAAAPAATARSPTTSRRRPGAAEFLDALRRRCSRASPRATCARASGSCRRHRLHRRQAPQRRR